MRNILFEDYGGTRLPPRVQQERMSRVILQELTAAQRDVLIAYYYKSQSIPAIAAERGVNKSTICRTLHRAEEKLRRFLKY